MNAITLHALFQSVQRLDHAVTQVAGYQAMTETEARLLTSMINTCTHAAEHALAVRAPEVPQAKPGTVVLSAGQIAGMDETFGHRSD